MGKTLIFWRDAFCHHWVRVEHKSQHRLAGDGFAALPSWAKVKPAGCFESLGGEPVGFYTFRGRHFGSGHLASLIDAHGHGTDTWRASTGALRQPHDPMGPLSNTESG